MSSSPLKKAPFGRLIKIMAAFGAAAVLFVIIASSQKPRTGPPALEDLAGAIPGFLLTQTPASLPAGLEDYLLSEGPEKQQLSSRVILYVWPKSCSRCELESRAIIKSMRAETDLSLVILRDLNAARAADWSSTLPAGVIGASAPASDMTSLVGNSREGVALIYANAREIGRARGVNWQDHRTKSLLDAIR